LAYHILQKESGTTLDPSIIYSKLLQLNRGRPVEDEFASLALWSSQCIYINKIDKGIAPHNSDFEIPDYLCIFKTQGQFIPVLVEVKTSKKETIKFTKKYFEGLKAFGALLGLPVLIAFKHIGGMPMWALFEIERMTTPRGTGKAHIFEILKNDLSSSLLGHFHFQILKGVAFVMKISKDKTYEDQSIDGTIQDVYWENNDGEKVHNINLLHLIFGLVNTDVKIEEFPSYIIQKFIKTDDDFSLASWVLPIAADYKAAITDKKINWAHVAQKNTFLFSLPEMKSSLEKAQTEHLLGPFIYIRPKVQPKFLKQTTLSKS